MGYSNSMGKLDKLKQIDEQVVQSVIATHKSSAISNEMVTYILQLNAIPGIIHYEGSSVTRVVAALRKQFCELSFSQAREIYYDAMNLFYIDDDVSSEAWDNYFAEKLEDLAQLAIVAGDYKTAEKCYSKSHDFKIRSTERIKPEAWHAPVFLINNHLRPEDLGYQKKSVYDIKKKEEDGFYTKQIEALPISKESKLKLFKDAAIDVKPEDIEDETD